MKNLTGILIISMAMITVACSKNDQQGSVTQPQAVAMLTATNRSVSVNTVNRDSVTLLSATAQAVRVKFEAKSRGNEIEYRSSEQRTIDLLSPTPISGNFSIPEGLYDEVEVRTQLEPLGGQPSLQFRAAYRTNGTIVPVVFSSMESLEVKGEKENITVDAGTGFNIMTLVDMAWVLKGISASDLNNAVRVNGEIQVNSGSNAVLYKRIVENLRSLEEECEIHHH